MLEEKLLQIETEREKEVSFWVQERGQMRDKIDQLECGGGQGILGKIYSPVITEDGNDHDANKRMMEKKVRSVEAELKKS